jgi:hypothetical protein
VLAGIHGRCYELFAHENVKAIRDLRGKRVAVAECHERFTIAPMVCCVIANTVDCDDSLAG